MKSFPKLFEPIAIGGMHLKNRVVMPAMGTNFATPDGGVTDQLIDYYVERAQGGVGLIITEVVSVTPVGAALHSQLHIHEDRYLTGLRRLAQAVQGCGARIAVQLHHAGRRATDMPVPLAPSPIAYLGGPPPRELTTAEIEALIEAFAAGAKRAREAGLDAVELHCTHGYLISQFLSPLTNKRTDRYGGNLENRMRFALETMAAIKRTAGSDFPVICRITGEEGIKGGITLEEAKVFAERLVQLGADAIHVSAGGIASSVEELRAQTHRNSPVLGEPRGMFVHLAGAMKEAVDVPVIAVGGINTPALAEQVIAERKADLVAIGRGLIADPGWGRKAEEGRAEDINLCLACSECNDAVLAKRGPLCCSVNASVGREPSHRITPAKARKRVIVVGGGPAGMEAARVAAERGHSVTLYDENSRLGGTLLIACLAKGKESIREFVAHKERELMERGVEIVLGRRLGAADVLAIRPDAVALAMGAEPALPRIPGIEKKIVCTGVDLLSGKVESGERPIVVGGGMVGCETAEFLAQKGKRVRLVTRRGDDGLAAGMSTRARQWFLSSVWSHLGVEVIPYSQFAEVVDRGLIVTDRQGARRLVEGDRVVFCIGMHARRELVEALEGKIRKLYLVGDCVEPRKIMEAVREGFEVGLNV